MLDKLGGVFAPRPSAGPHKLRESLPLVLILRNRLKYALTRNEVTKIVMQRTVKIDGKVRTDINFPGGFMGKNTFINYINRPLHRRHNFKSIIIVFKQMAKIDYFFGRLILRTFIMH